MELRRLRYFVVLAEVLHFGRAAERLRIAQPSLSEQIRRLEGELRTPLFERSHRRVELTEAGRLFLPEAREILAHVDRAALLARRASAGAGPLRVGFTYWMDTTPIVAWLGEFAWTADVGFEVPDPTRASDEDETPLLPGEEDGPEFAQDFVSED